MQDFVRYNDGSQNAPRLRFAHAFWGLIGLPFNCGPDNKPEWTLDEKFARVKEAGFEAVECWLDDSNEREVKDALDRHGLRLTLGHRPYTLDDVKSTLERAQRLEADFFFAQPASAFTPLDDVAKLVTEGRKMANDAGFAFFVETHRGNYTENIPQTMQLLERVPDIRFTADLSHFVVVGEFYGWEDEGADAHMMPILERTSHMHGRISSGEQVQVDVGDGNNDTGKFFIRLWTHCMKHWLNGAKPGDVLQFTPELGPPRYAITTPEGREISDRWEQSLVLKKMAEQAWQNAQSA